MLQRGDNLGGLIGVLYRTGQRPTIEDGAGVLAIVFVKGGIVQAEGIGGALCADAVRIADLDAVDGRVSVDGGQGLGAVDAGS